jgi:hypothetical protein
VEVPPEEEKTSKGTDRMSKEENNISKLAGWLVGF